MDEREIHDSSPQNPKGHYSVEEMLPEEGCSSREQNGLGGHIAGDNRRTFQDNKVFVFFAYGLKEVGLLGQLRAAMPNRQEQQQQ